MRVNITNIILDYLMRCMMSQNKEKIVPLFSALAKHVEFVVQFWATHFSKKIEELKSI